MVETANTPLNGKEAASIDMLNNADDKVHGAKLPHKQTTWTCCLSIFSEARRLSSPKDKKPS